MHLSEYTLEKIIIGEIDLEENTDLRRHLSNCKKCSSYLFNSQDISMDFSKSYPTFSKLQNKANLKIQVSSSIPKAHSQSGFLAPLTLSYGSLYVPLRALVCAGLSWLEELTLRNQILPHTPY